MVKGGDEPSAVEQYRELMDEHARGGGEGEERHSNPIVERRKQAVQEFHDALKEIARNKTDAKGTYEILDKALVHEQKAAKEAYANNPATQRKYEKLTAEIQQQRDEIKESYRKVARQYTEHQVGMQDKHGGH